MASITSLTSSSSSSSIYGTRNVISGLASGLDTESLIENSVSGYKTKINSLEQDRTKLEWQQEAYRSMISKLSSFSTQYASYTSATNLLSPSFFDSAVNTVSNGENASKVSASGRTSSDVQILGVAQLATAARYSVGTQNLEASNVAAEVFSLGEDTDVGKLSGTLTLGYGGKSISLSFSEKDNFVDENGAVTAEAMAKAINEKLADETISFTNGGQAKASDKIKAVADGNTIRFETVDSKDSNGVWIKSASSSLSSALGIPSKIESDDTSNKSFTFDAAKVSEPKKIVEQLAEKGFTIVLDGKTYSVKGPTKAELGGDTFDNLSAAQKEETYINELQKKIDAAIGTKNKLIVSDATVTKDENGNVTSDGTGIQLKFDLGEGYKDSKFQVTANAAAEALGMEGNLTSYVNTKQKLGDLVSLEGEKTFANSFERAEAVGTVSTKNGKSVDADGNAVEQVGDKWYRVDDSGKALYAFKVNGETVAAVNEDSTMQDLMDQINSNEDSDVKMSYSEFTGKFTFTAKDTGANGKVDLGTAGLAYEMFGGTDDAVYTAGQDAKFMVSVNGEEPEEITRSTNSIDIDGLKVTLKGTFGYEEDTRVRPAGAGEGVYMPDLEASGQDTFNINGQSYTLGVDAFLNENNQPVDINGKPIATGITFDGYKIRHEDSAGNKITDVSKQTIGKFVGGTEAVTFTTTADSDKIIETVKKMVEDYNAIATEVKKAYSTMPEQKSKGKYYEPLTDEDKEGMSESAIKSYEEKAKAGILFADRDLSNLYNDMLQTIQAAGTQLEKIGITMNYSDGLTTLVLNENDMKKALAEDPDQVKKVFTDSNTGIMKNLQVTMDTYGKTTGTKGILVEKAGSPLAPTSLFSNELYNKMQDVEDEITKWQDKISDQIDYYTNKFTYLEQLIAQMNNQSGMLMGLSGG